MAWTNYSDFGKSFVPRHHVHTAEDQLVSRLFNGYRELFSWRQSRWEPLSSSAESTKAISSDTSSRCGD
jgi:hypothetical protein